ncbi:MAG TPA: hypothetical protein VF543_21855 [Pyrinomonadaceae bacterium]|jgi:hypothetical protein
MNKSVAVLTIALLFGVGGIYAYSSGLTIKKPTAQQKSPINRKDQSRKIYKGLGNQNDPKIPEAAAKSKGDFRTEIEIGLQTLEPFAPQFNLRDMLKGRSCEADAIVIATIKSETSFLTEDETFLYTNHNVVVNEVIKDNPAATLQADDKIIVSRSGGTITLNGKKVYAVNKSALPLQLNKRYLLFLTYLPERGTYVADNISYLLENNKIFKTTAGPLPKPLESENEAEAFIQGVRIVVNEDCPNTQGGNQ